MTKELLNIVATQISQIILSLDPRIYTDNDEVTKKSILKLLQHNIYLGLRIQSNYNNDMTRNIEMKKMAKLYSETIYKKATKLLSKKERKEFSISWADML